MWNVCQTLKTRRNVSYRSLRLVPSSYRRNVVAARHRWKDSDAIDKLDSRLTSSKLGTQRHFREMRARQASLAVTVVAGDPEELISTCSRRTVDLLPSLSVNLSLPPFLFGSIFTLSLSLSRPFHLSLSLSLNLPLSFCFPLSFS